MIFCIFALYFLVGIPFMLNIWAYEEEGIIAIGDLPILCLMIIFWPIFYIFFIFDRYRKKIIYMKKKKK